MDTYKNANPNDYYTASEIAEILGLDKNTILNRCKKGYYARAIKLDPSSINPHGMWLIPKDEIDTPTTIKDVATLTRQITPAELQQAIQSAIGQAVADAVKPLHDEINNLKSQLDNVGKTQELLRVQGLTIIKKQEESIELTRAERKSQENRGFLARLFNR